MRSVACDNTADAPFAVQGSPCHGYAVIDANGMAWVSSLTRPDAEARCRDLTFAYTRGWRAALRSKEHMQK